MSKVEELDKLVEELEYAVLGAMGLGNDAAFKRVADTKEAIKFAVEELAKDAARYRWLRDSELDNEVRPWPAIAMLDDLCAVSIARSDMDAVIDAAMKEIP